MVAEKLYTFRSGSDFFGACYQKGLLMFAPVGVGGECLKISPPLTISEEALRESLAVFEEAIDQVMGA